MRAVGKGNGNLAHLIALALALEQHLHQKRIAVREDFIQVNIQQNFAMITAKPAVQSLALRPSIGSGKSIGPQLKNAAAILLTTPPLWMYREPMVI